MTKTKKQDFIEIKFTGYHDGKPFDSNIEEDLKQLAKNTDAQDASKTIVVIGEGFVVKGLDEALEDKELNKEYNIHIPYKDGFGERKRELVKTIPLSIFTQQKISPFPGQTLIMDNMLVRVITVSGARVVTDFNNPLAGKDIDYKFTIKRILDDEKDYNEKTESLFKFFFKTIPKYEIKENKITIKGHKPMEALINIYKDKLNELLKKDIVFEEEKEEEKGKAKIKHSNS